MTFSELPLHPELLKGVEALRFASPTPIQAQAIPPALAGADVVGSAQTGSGKTVAFCLPMLDRLMREPRKPARALVLVPTRELASQVEDSVVELTRFAPLKSALVIGGASWADQTKALKAGADIVVATPGRLLDHLENNRAFSLRDCRVCVLDEADRMLDMGFLPDIRRILSQIPRERQTMMFSATMPREIESLAAQFLRAPVRIQIDPPRRPAAGVQQKIYPVSQAQKFELLYALLSSVPTASVLIFTNTKRKADLVARFLNSKGLGALIMHSDKSQSQREAALDSFRDMKKNILVATDIAARGLDIRHVSHVINFDVPESADDYLHRIGRTARAFTVGDALTLMTTEEKPHMSSIEGFIGETIARVALEGFPYAVPPKLDAYRAPASSHFRMRRRIARSSRHRFR